MTSNARDGAKALTAQARALRAQASASCRWARAERERAEELASALSQSLQQCAGRPFGDRGGRFFLRLARARPLLAFARGDLRRWLERSGVPADVVQELTLAFSEACANALEHPVRARRQAVEIEAVRDESQLELRVRDFGRWQEQARSELRGRGLQIMRGLVDSLDVERGDGGTQVVLRRSLSGRPSCS